MPRMLLDGQSAELVVADVATGELRVVYRSETLLFEAPNWTPDGRSLVINGDGGLYTLPAAGGEPEPVDLGAVPAINNDHLVAPDNSGVYVSAEDFHIHFVDWHGNSRRITADKDPARRFMHFLHGVSPDGRLLAYVGVERSGERRVFLHELATGAESPAGDGFSPADGPEFGPDGEWLYFNSEIASAEPGHAQLFRARLDGSELTQLTYDERVNWFPHIAPDARHIAYVSFPPGTLGHPENLDVIVRLLDTTTGGHRDVAHVYGGQGTINVPSWSPSATHFAFVRYPLAE